ncbi:hypothetical protein F8388_004506 [Cannabis sativa]|uniref:DNA-directed RNA polymerase n=1 Tax=Cannabis sativa TaxID=3483 RepID=A0A7J6EQL9_CANSA|nr:hypothetical protein F8388_004506 [Cannabis sativa]
MQGHPVLLNRAPTLHRLGIQALQPILVEGHAIWLHPLVCKGFNADFGGDQMAVHVPLSLEAQAEARLLMFSHTNLLSQAIGDPISVPTQDMLIGLYVLTSGNRRGICANRCNPSNHRNYQNERIGDNTYKYIKEPFFGNSYAAVGAYRQKRIHLDSPLWLRWRLDQRVHTSREAPIEVHYESLGTYHEIYGHLLIFSESSVNSRPSGSTKNIIPEFLLKSRSRKGSFPIIDSNPLSNPTHQNMEVLMAERVGLVFHNKVIDGTAIKRLISRLIDHFGMAYTSHILDQVKTLGCRQATATSSSLGIDDLLTIPSKGWLVQDAEQQSLFLEKHHHYGNVHAIKKLRQSIEIWYATSEYLRQEMNPNFRMTDPFNLVHMMSFSGARGNASQVHQLVARKGVVDTAVRTSDAGYLTRRLVEVVQHIVVRRTDYGNIRGISVSSRNGMISERIFIQTLIRRVLADDIYRTTVHCHSSSRYCPTHGDLVELGEAVGIIAGQSIGEPGTQLTLRTFHTGGVFTGGTAKHVRAPSNGKIKYNEDLAHPTRTRHGHPAFLCSIDLDVIIESEDIIHNVTIPPKSLILVQNDQYVESEQVIAEIRTRTSTFNFKENVRKHIYSDSEGEMHWSTDEARTDPV